MCSIGIYIIGISHFFVDVARGKRNGGGGGEGDEAGAKATVQEAAALRNAL